MKRTIMTMTMVLGCTLCTQSFGFDLLDRMLGVKGCGTASNCCDVSCEPACGVEATPCGCAAEPACGCEAPVCGCPAEPACGFEIADCGCAAEPACGLEAAGCGCAAGPTCGCEVAACDSGCAPCGDHHGGGLLAKLFSHRNHGCDSGCDIACGAPACGCEVAACESGCDSLCGGHNGGLLSRLFGHLGHNHGCDSGCDLGCEPACGFEAPACGCSGGYSVPSATPMPSVDQEAAPMPPAPIVDPSASVTKKRRVVQASAVYVR